LARGPQAESLDRCRDLAFFVPKIPFDASIRGDFGSVPRVCQHPKGMLADHTLWHMVLKDKASIAFAIWLFLFQNPL